MNHYGLFIKLMDRCIPAQLLLLLENWFKSAVTCVKWGTAFSEFFSHFLVVYDKVACFPLICFRYILTVLLIALGNVEWDVL